MGAGPGTEELQVCPARVLAWQSRSWSFLPAWCKLPVVEVPLLCGAETRSKAHEGPKLRLHAARPGCWGPPGVTPGAEWWEEKWGPRGSSECRGHIQSTVPKGGLPQILLRAELVLSLGALPTPCTMHKKSRGCAQLQPVVLLSITSSSALPALSKVPFPCSIANPDSNSTKVLSSVFLGPLCHISVFISPSPAAPFSGAEI